MVQYEPTPQSSLAWFKEQFKKINLRLAAIEGKATATGSGGGGGGASPFLPGFVQAAAFSSAPSGWLACDGSAVSRTTYAALYAAIGTTYGSGDGSSTFNLPNLADKVAVGYGSLGAVGTTGGEASHTLTVAEMPAHGHGINDSGHGHGISDPGHGHSVYDPGHGHGVNDPQHSHGAYSNNAGNHTHGPGGPGNTFWTGGSGQANNVSSTSPSTNRTTTSTTTNPGDHSHGVGTYNAGTGISIQGSGTGISIYGNGTGVSVNGSTTGISVQGTGGGGAHNNMQPYVVLRYLVKT